MLDRAAIDTLLPHAGRMCLLDRVLNWDTSSIRCSAVSHRDADNPLREGGGLAALAGIEYAAQVAALHGGLLSGATRRRSGVLASLRNVISTRDWLHDIAGEIMIEAALLHSDPAGGIFNFSLFAGAERILSGQFTLMYIDDAQENHA